MADGVELGRFTYLDAEIDECEDGLNGSIINDWNRAYGGSILMDSIDIPLRARMILFGVPSSNWAKMHGGFTARRTLQERKRNRAFDEKIRRKRGRRNVR